jgi:hypothetical protein
MESAFPRGGGFVLPIYAREVYNRGTMEQGKFEFPKDEAEPRRKRYKRRKPVPPPKAAAPQEQALVSAPVVQKCGFCGDNQTVMGEMHVCTKCGGILLRRECEEE